MKVIEFEVLGTPAPKGSSRAMLTKKGKAVNVPSGSSANRKALASWSTDMRAAASAACFAYWKQHGDPVQAGGGALVFGKVPLRIKIIWRMRRPGGHFHKTGPQAGQLRAGSAKYPTSKPDGSKLLRSTEDDLTGIVYLDDAHIAEWYLRKVYAAPGKEGAWIRIEELEDVP